ncbi:LuxR C-terminal-related transcriptional regulator [Microbacterium sp. HD4P20]|uniref:LuxR family transcriptional regulator n=1 Tax=Microbacterium sp. HD4P20 TaxID=2864874 RepID=UPI0020A4627C|nr:LuxR family transcriptional regulator [Microbacterium sp. HD4P20]MCP2638276.1 LuxR C-terminal-related transcriptional regulator [Microbacterium sp. HD4P20]
MSPHLDSNTPAGDPVALNEFAAHVAAGRFAEAASLVRRDWIRLLESTDQRLARILEPLPPHVFDRFPTLAVLLGVAYIHVPHRRLRSEQYFQLATKVAGEGRPGTDPADQVLVLAAAAVAHRLLGRPEAGAAAAAVSLSLLTRLPLDRRSTVGALSRIYSQLGTTLYYGARRADAIRAFELGLAESPREGHPDGFGNVAMLAGIHALDGAVDEASAYLDLARAPGFDDADRAGYPATFYRLAEATSALERFDAPGARAHLAAMQHDRRTIEHWPAIAAVEAAAGLIEGRPAEAQADLEALVRLRGSQGKLPAPRRMLAPSRALFKLALGDTQAAEAILTRDGQGDVVAHVGLARVALAIGRPGAALARARDLVAAPLSPRLTAELYTVELAALALVGSARTHAVADELAALADRTRQGLALALIPDDDYQRVLDLLGRRGHDALVERLPPRAVLPGGDVGARLTDRERVVLQHLAGNRAVAAIAAELHVSVNTVKTQLKSVYRKLGVNSRDAALAMAYERHLITLDRRAPSDGATRG